MAGTVQSVTRWARIFIRATSEFYALGSAPKIWQCHVKTLRFGLNLARFVSFEFLPSPLKIKWIQLTMCAKRAGGQLQCFTLGQDVARPANFSFTVAPAKKKKNCSGIQLVLRESSDDAPNLAGRSFHHQMSAIFGDEHFKVLTRDGVYSKTNHWVQHGL